jgi:hypothetical protein
MAIKPNGDAGQALPAAAITGFGLVQALQPELQRLEMHDVEQRDIGDDRRQEGVLDDSST